MGITQKSSIEQDIELYRGAWSDCVNAVINSNKALSGCAYGQANRNFHNSVNNEVKMQNRFFKIEDKISKKYNVNTSKLEVEDICAAIMKLTTPLTNLKTLTITKK